MVSGATNDNVIKTAFVVAISVLHWPVFNLDDIFLVNLAAICFILPFLIFAAPASKFSKSKSPKKTLIKLKAVELGLACIASLAIFLEQGVILLACIVGFGVQSAFVGPLKYSLLPMTQPAEMLLSANAWMQAGTFLAILVGTLIGSDWIIESNLALILLIPGLAITGLLSVMIIELPKFTQTRRSPTNLIELIRSQLKDPMATSAMLCISGFWGIGSVWLTHLPLLVTDTWSRDPGSIPHFLTLFVFGIASGAILGVVLRKQTIGTRVISGSAVMVIGSILLQSPILAKIALFLTALGGGFLTLPLYTQLQQKSELVVERIATNNVFNALMILIYAAASIITLKQLNLSLVIWLLILSIVQFCFCVQHRSNLHFHQRSAS